jgi:hypothetical protein
MRRILLRDDSRRSGWMIFDAVSGEMPESGSDEGGARRDHVPRTGRDARPHRYAKRCGRGHWAQDLNMSICTK